MKTKYLFVIIMITLIGVQSRTTAQIGKEQAIGIVKSSLTNEELQNWNVLVFPDLIKGQEFHLSPYHVLHSTYDESWLFLIDMYPTAQWDHACNYIFLDQQTGNYTTINYSIPPQDYWYGWEYVNSPHPYPVNIPLYDSIQVVSNNIEPDPHKYAVLLCWNESEPGRWNNLSHIYCGIKRNYGFMDENIFVLSGNGTVPYPLLPNLDNDFPIDDFDGPCTKDSIIDVFNFLDSVMTNEDILFVYANSHGHRTGQDTSYLRLWNFDTLFDYELADLVNGIDCSQKIFGIDACHSGDFVDDLDNDHSTIQTCVSGDTVSWHNPGLGFGEMSFWWGTALRGRYPSSDKSTPWENGPKIGEHDSLYTISSIDSTDFNPDDTLGGNHDGFIQFQEAFNFAYRYASDVRDRNGQNYINEGFQGDLLTLNGIEGRVDTSQSISGNFLIGRKLTLAPGVVLSDNSSYLTPLNLYLNDSTEILVQDSATLNINGPFTKFTGCIGESFVNIEGDISADHMNFQANSGSTINVNFNNPSKMYDLEYFDFENAAIHAACDSLSFYISGFDNSPFEFTGSRLVLNNSNLFSESPLEFSGNYLTITDSNDFESSGLDLNSGTVTIDEVNDFNDSDIEFSGDELYITGPNHFTGSNLVLSNGNIVIDEDNGFINSTITISHPLDEAAFIEIIGNSFENDTTVAVNTVITIEDYRNFQIDDNNLIYDAGRGIEIFNAGWDGRGLQQILGNSFELSQPSTSLWSDVGIHSYFTNADIRNNQILKNSYGLVGFHNSDLVVLGDSAADDYSETQLIADNTRSQCLFNIDCFPNEFHWNVIRDTIQYSYQYHPFIKTVEYDELMQDTSEVPDWRGNPYLDVIHNCWVNDTNPADDRLVPIGAYLWRSPWCPGGGGHLKSEDIPGNLYYQAESNVKLGNYTMAESGYKQVIADFPANKYAMASLKGLFALNPALYDSNYSYLKSYCDSLVVNPGDSLLGKSAEWFSIRCNIENQNYQQAINSLDSIIENPGTYADSVFALIDLSEVFEQMSDSAGLKLSLVTRNPQVIPVSHQQFVTNRKDWINLLLKPGESYSKEIFPTIDETDALNQCRITSIHPNPSSGEFTIRYSLTDQGKIRILLLSNSGQVISVLKESEMQQGNYTETLQVNGLSTGIYLVTISFNNLIEDSRKLIIIK